MGLFSFLSERADKKLQEKEEKQAQIRQVLEQGRTLEAQGKDKEAYAAYRSIWEQSAEAAVAGADVLWRNKAHRDLFRFCTECEAKTHGYNGYSPVLKWLAYCYKDGLSTEKDLEKAYKTMSTYLSRSDNDKDVQACLFLAECADTIYKNIEETRVNWDVDKANLALAWKAKAQKYWEKASQNGDVTGMLQAARYADSEEAFQYYTMACRSGGHQAAAEMFWRFIHAGHQHTIPERFNMQTLGEQLQCGADAGNPDCMLALALCYAKDFVGTYGFEYRYTDVSSPFKPDSEKFFYWLKKAYESGCSDAGVAVMMAQYYATGKIWHHSSYGSMPTYTADVPEIDQEKAFTILEPIYLLLQSHINDSNYDTKVHYWFAVSKPLLAMMYLDGRGTQADPEKAFACVGIGYHKNTMLVGRGYASLCQARIALQEAINAEEGPYTLVFDEDA